MEKNTWEEVVKFHGHECPGLAIGYRAALEARKLLGVKEAEDEEIVCITENDACGVDAIQALLSCTVGKGNLIFKLRGKQAYSFYNRNTKKSVRVVLKARNNGMSRSEYQEYLLEAPFDELYDVKEVDIDLPEEAKLFNSYKCHKCGEYTAENHIRIQDGQYICQDCADHYSRII